MLTFAGYADCAIELDGRRSIANMAGVIVVSGSKWFDVGSGAATDGVREHD